MQNIVGRVVFIGNNNIVEKKDYSFSTVIFVIKKKMNGKIRNISFSCIGKIADEVLKYKKDDKVEVEFYIDSRMSKNRWFTDLKATSVFKIEKITKSNESQLNMGLNY